jgi:hypothetical protein
MKERDIIISSGNGAQKLLGCYIRNINNFEYSISVEITADSLGGENLLVKNLLLL